MRRALGSIILVAPVFLALDSSETSAQWAPNGFNVCNAANNQTDIQSIPDGAGGAFLVWHDGRSGPPSAYAQRLNAAGVPQWAPNGVLVSTLGQRPRLVSDGAGGIIVAYLGSGAVAAQRLNSAGVAQWGAGVVLSTLIGQPRLAADGSGGAVVTWSIGSQPTRDIQAQRVNSAGANQWGVNGIAVCRHPSDQRDVEVISDGAGGAIIAWVDLRSSTQRTFARRVTAVGDTSWTVMGNAVSPNAPAAFQPALWPDGAGGAFVVSSDQRNAAGTQLYVHRINSSGATQAGWNSAGVDIGGAGSVDPKAVVTTDGAGGVIVTRVGGRVDRVTPTATPMWGVEVVPFPNAFTMPVRVALATDGNGGAYVAWDDFRNSTDSDVYASHVKSDGTINGACTENGDPVCQFAGTQQSPTVCHANGAGAIVAWSDSRVAGADVYADLSTCMATVDVDPAPLPDAAIAAVTAWPNPFAGDLTVAFTLPTTSPAELVLYDARGRVVLRQSLDPGSNGRGVVRLAAPRELAAGSYFLHVVQDGVASAGRKVTLAR